MNYSIEEDQSFFVSVFKFCFYITLVSNLVIFIAQPIDFTLLEALASRCFMLTNLLAFVIAIMHSAKKYVPYITMQIITIFFILCFSIISFLLYNQGGFYQYIIRMWCYLALPFYFLYINYLTPDKKLINTLFIINILTSFVYILLSFSKYSYKGYESFLGTNNAWLTLGYDNPNQTAMYIVINMIILICAFHYYRKKSIKFLLFLDICYLCILLFRTSSRTCILIGVVIILADIFKRSYRINKAVIIVTLFLPLLFLIIYPFLNQHNMLFLFSFGGKTDYASRSQIFQAVLVEVQDKFLFGEFGKYQLQNLHNGILCVYASLGLVGVILFYIYFIRAYINLIEGKIKSKAAFISSVGLLSVFLHACTEGAFIIGGSVFAASLSALIYLTKLEGREW